MRRALLAITVALALTFIWPAIAAASPPESCEVKATGGLSFESKGTAKAGSFGSDYWLTDDELRMGLKVMAGLGSKLTDAEKAKKVDEAMKGDPRFMLFLLNCQTEKVNISFGPSSQSKYKDVPMKPKTYAISKGGGKPGEMQVLLSVKENNGFWRAQPGGKLDITAFDKKHIAGTFEVTVKEGLGSKEGAEAKLTGSFDFPCKASKSCEK